MNVLKFLPAIAFLSFIMVSCSDDDGGGSGGGTPASRTQLLTAKNWSVITLTVEPAIDFDQNGTQETNLIPFIQACTLDDFERYATNGTYTFEEGASKCDPNDPQVYESGTWLWNSDETRLVRNNAGQTSDVLVSALTNSSMTQVLTTVQQGVTYTFTATYN